MAMTLQRTSDSREGPLGERPMEQMGYRLIQLQEAIERFSCDQRQVEWLVDKQGFVFEEEQ